MAVSMIIPPPQQQSLSPRTALHDKRIQSHNRRVALRRHQGAINLLQQSSHHDQQHHQTVKDGEQQQNDLTIESVASAAQSTTTIPSTDGCDSTSGLPLNDSSHHDRTEHTINNDQTNNKNHNS